MSLENPDDKKIVEGEEAKQQDYVLNFFENGVRQPIVVVLVGTDKPSEEQKEKSRPC